jgi:hypothetical protein
LDCESRIGSHGCFEIQNPQSKNPKFSKVVPGIALRRLDVRLHIHAVIEKLKELI